MKNRVAAIAAFLLTGAIIFVPAGFPAAIAADASAPVSKPSPPVQTNTIEKGSVQMRGPAGSVPLSKRLSSFHSFTVDEHQEYWTLDTDVTSLSDLSVYLEQALIQNPKLPKDSPAEALIQIHCLYRSCATIRMDVVDRQSNKLVWQTETGAYQGYFQEKDPKKIATGLINKLSAAYQQDARQSQPVLNQTDKHTTDRWWHWW